MRRSVIGMVLGLLVGLAAMTGCSAGGGGLSERQIIDLLPSTITDYSLKDSVHTQEVSSLTVVKADVTDDAELVDCEITLEDEDLTRTVYAQLSLKKYEVGGWQLEWWAPYQLETVQKPPLPTSADADAYMARYGYTGMRDGGEDTSTSGDIYYEKSYIIDEAHTYATFSGTATYRATLTYYGADSETCASYGWREEADFSGLSVTWDVAGRWTGVEVDREENDPYAHVDRLPHKFEFDLAEPDEHGNVQGSGAYYYPAVYPGRSEYTGDYGSYDFLSASARTDGSSPSDATLTMSVNTYHTFNFSFTPDTVTVSCRLLDYTCMFDATRADR